MPYKCGRPICARYCSGSRVDKSKKDSRREHHGESKWLFQASTEFGVSRFAHCSHSDGHCVRSRSCIGAGFLQLDPRTTLGVTASTAGVLLPGLLVHDLFNWVVGTPILVGLLWFARCGSLVCTSLWPGGLFYALYTYAAYVAGAPFTVLFLAYVSLVALSGYSISTWLASIDGERVRKRLVGVVPARAIGAVLVALALLTLGQDGGGAMATVLGSAAPSIPIARHIWTADHLLEVPALVIGGLLLWKRERTGFVVGPGLLFQFGLTPAALSVMLALQPALTASPIDLTTIMGLLIFALVSFAPLGFLFRGRTSGQPAV